MLNISKNTIRENINSKPYTTLKEVELKISGQVLKKLIYFTLGISLIVLFLPWTQNIRSYGSITTLKPNQKPQNINAIIAGRIDEWYVQEGDQVEAGDTLLKISEIKDKFFDPELIQRTSEQVKFLEESIENYDEKILTLRDQEKVLLGQRDFKLKQAKVKIEQAELKVQNDSLKYIAAKIDLETAEFQYKRMDSLYRKGFKSLTDLEKRNLSLQKSTAAETEARNNWLNNKNQLINLQIELSNIQLKFESDLNKTRSKIFTAVSEKLDKATKRNKLANELKNYEVRTGLYYITSPQRGYITRTISSGIGETIKEGDKILTIMPSAYDLAVATYVDPLDLPLIQIGEKVMIQFDGWPAIVFSGWPNLSHGTYSGEIYAIDQFISENGKYRVLVQPDPEDYPWPKALRYGSGTNTMILLSDVPIWYELWRNINGFPAEYYQPVKADKKDKKK